jgi:hypothetical protein
MLQDSVPNNHVNGIVGFVHSLANLAGIARFPSTTF